MSTLYFIRVATSIIITLLTASDVHWDTLQYTAIYFTHRVHVHWDTLQYTAIYFTHRVLYTGTPSNTLLYTSLTGCCTLGHPLIHCYILHSQGTCTLGHPPIHCYILHSQGTCTLGHRPIHCYILHSQGAVHWDTLQYTAIYFTHRVLYTGTPSNTLLYTSLTGYMYTGTPSNTLLYTSLTGYMYTGTPSNTLLYTSLTGYNVHWDTL